MFEEQQVMRREVRGLHNQSLGSCLQYLETHRFDPNTEYLEVVIDVRRHPVAVEDLKRLLALPFEVSLSEYEGNLLFVTGVVGSVPSRSHRHQTSLKTSRYALHTHPLRSREAESYDSPSPGDLQFAANSNPRTVLGVIHGSGISIFRTPHRHPITGVHMKSATRDDITEMHDDFLRALNICSRPTEALEKKDVRLHSSLSGKEQAALQKSFARASGALVGEIGWHESKSLQHFLKPINAGPRAD